MLSAISRLDSFIQRCVDAAAFAVMRTCGVRKSFVRYVVMAIAVSAIIGDVVFRYKTVLAKALSLAMCFALLMLAEVTRRRDEHAEARGFRDSGASLFDVVFKVYFGGQVFVQAYNDEWFMATFDVFVVLSTYLAATPNTPPPSEQRSPSLSAVPEAT